MRFSTLVLKNLVRQRVRTLLTILGIGVGITTVVALGAITGGLKAMASDLMRVGGADFMVAQKGASDLSFSTVSEAEERAVRETPGVEQTLGVLLHYSRVGSNPFFVTFGVRAEELRASPPALVEGRLLAAGAPREALLGSDASTRLAATVGGTVTIEETDFRVVGIYRTGSVAEDGGAYAPLDTVQRLARKRDAVTAVYVTAEPGADAAALAARIEEENPELTSVSTLGDYGDVDQGMKFLDAGNVAISVLAVLLGGIGVMNTMIMSVFERTREIGILRAVGWSGRRIVRMVLGESLLLCLVAGVLGLGLGWLAAQAVAQIPSVESFLRPEFSSELVLRALLVAVGVALAGAAYPAVRAVRLLPVEALRHE
jgi:putative ABC transport system permease protein